MKLEEMKKSQNFTQIERKINRLYKIQNLQENGAI